MYTSILYCVTEDVHGHEQDSKPVIRTIRKERSGVGRWKVEGLDGES